MTSNEARIKELTEKMLCRKLYVVVSTPTCSLDQLTAVLPSHLEYMIELEKRGILFASGPISASDGSLKGEGMTILRAASFEEAQQLAAADPFYLEGLRTFEVKEWTLMEGSLQITVNFSGRSLAIA